MLTEKHSASRWPGWVVAALFLIAFATRALWLLVDVGRTGDFNALEFPDERDYWQLASSLTAGDGLVGEHGYRALRMPLYPWLLSIVANLKYGVFLARLVQCAMGALSSVFVANLARRLAGPIAGVLAGVLVACDPFLIFFSSLLLTETLSVTCLTAFWLVGWNDGRKLGWRRWLAVGLLAGLNVYARESSLGLCVLWIAYLSVRDGLRWFSFVGGLMSVVVIFALLLPWAMRNERVTGRWCFLTNRGGISLYDGVGPQATGASDLAQVKQMSAVRGLDEAAWNDHFIDASIESVRSDPWRALSLVPKKIARTWNPMPNAEGHVSWFKRAVGLIWNVPIYLLCAFAIRRWRSVGGRVVIALLLPAAYVTVLHSVFVGSLRYRLPAMPMIEVLAAIVLAEIIRRKACPARVRG